MTECNGTTDAPMKSSLVALLVQQLAVAQQGQQLLFDLWQQAERRAASAEELHKDVAEMYAEELAVLRDAKAEAPQPTNTLASLDAELYALRRELAAANVHLARWRAEGKRLKLDAVGIECSPVVGGNAASVVGGDTASHAATTDLVAVPAAVAAGVVV